LWAGICIIAPCFDVCPIPGENISDILEQIRRRFILLLDNGQWPVHKLAKPHLLNRHMTNQPKFKSIYLTLVAVAGFAASAASTQAQSASAMISGMAVAGGFDYTITLLNNGSSSLQGFWYGWTDSGNNLPSNPSTAASSVGWAVNFFGGNSIQWQGTAGTALAAGNSATFTFFDTSTPAAITTSPSGESVAYTGTIQFNQATPGVSSPVFSPVLVASPEPSSIALLAFGSLGLLAGGWRKLRAQQ
jgi:hypothetical protein